MVRLPPKGANSSAARPVIAGLDPAIQEPSFVEPMSRMDGRIKSGHDGQYVSEPGFAP